MSEEAYMKSIIYCAGFVLGASAAFAAVPSISNVVVTQPRTDRSCKVHVTYALTGADAIVTADVKTNGVSIAGRFASMAGDVNCKVSAGEGVRRFSWDVRGDWPDQKLDITVSLKAWLPGAAPDYMVIDLDGGDRRFYASADDVPLTVTNSVYKRDKLVMRRIPAAGVTWRMGQPIGGERCDGNAGNAKEASLRDNETAHFVAFADDFYIGIFEVTQQQYRKITGASPSTMKTGTGRDDVTGFPVETVSYDALRGIAADSFLGWPQTGHVLGEGAKLQAFRDRLGLNSIDLPTEAQWEFACRAGTTSALNSGEECGDAIQNHVDGRLDKLGWYVGNAKPNESRPEVLYEGPREVGLKLPNAWGLYDMHGNVHEWCLDWLSLGDAYRATFAADWAAGGVTVDPKGATSGTHRVMRGGDYFYSSAWARSACRSGYPALPSDAGKHHGFRIVCSGTLD